MRARGVPTRRDVNADDQFVRTKRMFKMRRRSRQPIQVGEKEAPIARAASTVKNCRGREIARRWQPPQWRLYRLARCRTEKGAWLYLSCHAADGSDDARVGAATADVTAHPLARLGGWGG